MRQLDQFFDQAIEPAALCRNCEYFDGGGMGRDGVPINFEGDCGNSRAPAFQTNQDKTCKQFFPCTAKYAREAFVEMCHGPAVPPDAWKALKIEGWRIVKVKVTEA